MDRVVRLDRKYKIYCGLDKWEGWGGYLILSSGIKGGCVICEGKSDLYCKINNMINYSGTFDSNFQFHFKI